MHRQNGYQITVAMRSRLRDSMQLCPTYPLILAATMNYEAQANMSWIQILAWFVAGNNLQKYFINLVRHFSKTLRKHLQT
jgi:hypothetical protein